MNKKHKPSKFKRKSKTRPRGKERLTDATAIIKVERRYQAITMRRDGYTVREISQAMGVGEHMVRTELKEVLNETLIACAETAEENRQLQVERLNALLKSTMPYAIDEHKEVRVDLLTGQEVIVCVPPDPKYVNTVLNIEARRAKLLALDIPETKHLDITGVREYVGVDVDEV